MKKFAKNFTLVIFSIAISIFAAEIVARLVAPQNLSGQWRIEAETGGYQLNKDHGESRHQIGDRVVHYNFGEHNLRVGPARPKASHRVLVLGDSFTFGHLLNWQDSYVGRLQKAADDVFGLGAVEFLNAASIGWGTSDYVAYY